jgi:hypothetical protein
LRTQIYRCTVTQSCFERKRKNSVVRNTEHPLVQ